MEKEKNTIREGELDDRHGLTVILLFSVFFLSTAVNSAFAIEPYEKDPRWWQYRGNPITLRGASGDDNLFQWEHQKMVDHLDEMISAGGNYLRCTMSDRQKGIKGIDEKYAFKKLENGKFDLDEWNEEYWKQFKTFLEESQKRNIIVQVTLWDPHDWNKGGTWSTHPWNPKNNVTYDEWPTMNNHPPTRRKHMLMHTIPSLEDVPRVRKYLDRFARKMMSITLQFDHILYNVENESRAPVEWQTYWSEFMHNRAKKAGKNIYLTSMVDGLNYDHLANQPERYNYVDVSQQNKPPWKFTERIRNKVIPRVWDVHVRPVNHVKNYDAGKGRAVSRFWASTFVPVAGVRYHRDEGKWGIGLNPASKASLKSVRMLENRLSWFDLKQPDSGLLKNPHSDKQKGGIEALATPGKQYAILFLYGGKVDLDLSSETGTFKGHWLNAEKSQWKKEEVTLSGGKTHLLKAPTGGIWVLALRKQ